MRRFAIQHEDCPGCGTPVNEGDSFCPKCGRPLREGVEEAKPPGKEKNKWVAFFLCLFLGFIGVHKFYEEKPCLGICYMCTFGFAFLGVIIDLMLILGKPTTYYV